LTRNLYVYEFLEQLGIPVSDVPVFTHLPVTGKGVAEDTHCSVALSAATSTPAWLWSTIEGSA